MVKMEMTVAQVVTVLPINKMSKYRMYFVSSYRPFYGEIDIYLQLWSHFLLIY